MKKILLSFVAGLVMVSLVGTSWAAMITGKVDKIDEKGSYYFVKDEKGKTHKIHFDTTTKKTGEVKIGADVKVDEEKGHAKSVEVIEKKM